MERYDLINGSAGCFTDEIFAECPEETLREFDLLMTGGFIVLLFCSVTGNWLVNCLFRVYNIVRREGSVSHVCLSHVAVSDLIYSVIVTPLTLSLLMTRNRFFLELEEGVFTALIYQIVGFTGVVTRRASLLFLTIVAVDQTLLLYLPSFHHDHLNLVSIKTAVHATWVSSIVFGIMPFMTNSAYEMVPEMVSPQWNMVQELSGTGGERNKLNLVFVVCQVIPVLAPAIFLSLSNIVLILKVDLKKRRDYEPTTIKKKYDPFSFSTREIAMRIASSLGDAPPTGQTAGSKRRGMKRLIRTITNATLNSLRPITSVYILCNTLWFLTVGHDWRTPKRADQLFGEKGHLHVVSLVLVHLSVALTPLLHFLCSRQMRQGLVVLLGGYSSMSALKAHHGFRKRPH